MLEVPAAAVVVASICQLRQTPSTQLLAEEAASVVVEVVPQELG
jgi:hypothetical protein